jgi:hypothetical protein
MNHKTRLTGDWFGDVRSNSLMTPSWVSQLFCVELVGTPFILRHIIVQLLMGSWAWTRLSIALESEFLVWPGGRSEWSQKPFVYVVEWRRRDMLQTVREGRTCIWRDLKVQVPKKKYDEKVGMNEKCYASSLDHRSINFLHVSGCFFS